MALHAPIATAGWLASAMPAWIAFRRALSDPRGAQERVLRRLLAHGAHSAFGREHGLGAVRTGADLVRAVPLRTWDELAPWVVRAANGERDVLTVGEISRFEPTSGTTSARKLVPSTAASRWELRQAVGAWVLDTYRRDPHLAGGRAYWSISPRLPPERTVGGIPIGFDDDAGYLGGISAALVRAALVAVPTDGEFWRDTARALLAAADLRLVSVWNPSFLALALDAVEACWDDLLAAQPPRVARSRTRPWPRLRLWSAWADAGAAGEIDAVRARLPGVAFQAKGLLATEGVVSIPFAGTHPLAVTSHWMELASDDGAVQPLWSAREGEEGEVVLTTGAGLWRYRLGDRVRITGRLGNTPTLRFLGRARTVDQRGEKLTEAFVAAVLDRLGIRGFAMLAPEGQGYVLYAELPVDVDALERGLAANPHYAWCVRIGQLAPVQVRVVPPGAGQRYLLAQAARGRRLGGVKLPRLEAESGWEQVLGAERPYPSPHEPGTGTGTGTGAGASDEAYRRLAGGAGWTIRVAVIGHVEWVTFLRVNGRPEPGAILRSQTWWDEAAGGGGVAAAELARLAGRCTLVTAAGSDPIGRGLASAFSPLGVDLVAAIRDEPHRRGITLLDPDGERTIVVQGPVQAARGADRLPLDAVDAVYFCKGDAAMVREARRSRVLVATARELPTLREAGVHLDALVHSARDPSETYRPGDLDPAPLLVATTEGARGGSWSTSDGNRGRWVPAPQVGPPVDTYGAGDCFAAGLAFALAEGMPIEAALAFAADRGALAHSRRGAHGST